MTGPTPHPQVVSAPWEDGLVLFDLRDRRLHELNHTAAAVWRDLAGAGDGGAVARLVRESGVDPGRAGAQVDQITAELLRLGLIHTGDRAPAPAGDADLSPAGRADAGPYRAGEWSFDLRCDDVEFLGELERVFAPLRFGSATPTTGAAELITVAVRRRSDGQHHVDIAVEGRPQIRAARPGLALDHLVALVNNRAVLGTRRCVALHAGAVTVGGCTVVLPGVSNSGKSTLTAALVRRGHRYVSDEAVFVDPDRPGPLPYPKAVSLDVGSFPLLPELRPTVGPLLEGDLGRKWHSVVDDAPVSVGAPFGVVVAPTHQPGSATTLTRLGARDALDLLLANSFDFGPAGAPGFAAIVAMAQLPTHRLTSGSLDEAVAAVESAVADSVGAPLAAAAGARGRGHG